MSKVQPKIGRSRNDDTMHYSVGAIIERDGKYLLTNRMKPPPGYASLSGHIDEGENPDVALLREVMEESGL